MKTRYYILTLMLLFVVSASYAQESEKKSKEERKMEQQNQTKELVDSKIFLFVGSTAYSERGRSVTITSGPNTVSFNPDLVKSNLPFFGEAKTASAGFGSQTGYAFEGKPEEYTVENVKKGYKLKAVIKANNETYTLNLTISSDGNANLNIYSIKRSSMRYNGEIRKPEEK